MTTTLMRGEERRTAAPVRLVPIDETMIEAIERLLDLAFGTDRRLRTAYRLREGVAAAPDASCAAVVGASAIVGSLQTWPLALASDGGAPIPLWLVGPIAVLPERRNQGIARAMVARALRAIDQTGLSAVLIGDLDYYGPFGFSAAATAGWAVPGPVERERLLCRAAPDQRLPASGTLGPRVPDPR